MSTINSFILSLRSISFSYLVDLQDWMISSCTMIWRRGAIMVFISKNRRRIIGLSVWNCFKNGSTIPAMQLVKRDFPITRESANEDLTFMLYFEFGRFEIGNFFKNWIIFLKSSNTLIIRSEVILSLTQLKKCKI